MIFVLTHASMNEYDAVVGVLEHDDPYTPEDLDHFAEEYVLGLEPSVPPAENRGHSMLEYALVPTYLEFDAEPDRCPSEIEPIAKHRERGAKDFVQWLCDTKGFRQLPFQHIPAGNS